MKTLHKYLTGQVLASLLLTVMVFTFVLLLGDLLKEVLPLLISGHAPPGIIFKAIALLIPFVWVYALPMGLLTATLLVFGRFSADQELTAARASGVSLLSLVMPVLLLSLFFCGISAWINMELGPRCRAEYKNLLLQLRSDLMNVQLPEGRFIRDFPGYIFYVGRNHDGELEDVMVDWLEHNTTFQAPRGQLVMDSTNKQLTLDLFDATSVTMMTNGTALLSSIREWPIPIVNTSTNRTYSPEISNMTFWQLRDKLAELQQQLDALETAAASSKEESAQIRAAAKQPKILAERVRVEMNRQVAFSFACFGFTLVGIPLGIRVHRRETNIGVAIALGLVLVYYSFMLVGESLSTHPDWSPHLIFWLPNFIFQGVGAVLLWRANRGI